MTTQDQDMPELSGSALATWCGQQPGTHRHQAAQVLMAARKANLTRREAILKHPDLAARLVSELSFGRPEQWNGFIPPATVNTGPGEKLRIVSATGAARMNQGGCYSEGEQPNTSPRRAALLSISAEAWRREHENGAKNGSIPGDAR